MMPSYYIQLACALTCTLDLAPLKTRVYCQLHNALKMFLKKHSYFFAALTLIILRQMDSSSAP